MINKNSRFSVIPSIILLWDKSCRNPDLSLDTKLPDIFGSRVALYKTCASHRIKAVNNCCIVQIHTKIWTVTFATAESFQTKTDSHEFKAINVTLGFSFSPSASYFFNACDSQHPNPCVKRTCTGFCKSLHLGYRGNKSAFSIL